jgi:hypothetical protein
MLAALQEKKKRKRNCFKDSLTNPLAPLPPMLSSVRGYKLAQNQGFELDRSIMVRNLCDLW